MNPEPLNESKDKVTERLDARVYNSPTELLLPASPTDPEIPKGPDTKTIQPSDPTTQIVYHLPNKNANSYELEKFKENRMIIFNHDHFKSGLPRPGTDKDETALRETFNKFRFTIDPTHKNLKIDELDATLKKFALETDFRPYGCICVAILTHGHKKPGILKAYDGAYSEYEIYKHFDALQNSSLAGKPIIFIIQACRGRKPSKKVDVGEKKSSPQLDLGEEWEHYYVPTEADRLVFHSSYPGRASIRDPDDGSWFIKELCVKINECALHYDLETIFRLVRRAVALHGDEEEVDWKQMPVVTSTTLREIKLAPTVQLEEEQPQPTSASVFKCVKDDPQLSEKLEEHVGLSAPSSTLQCEKKPPRPASPFVFRCEVDDPRVYPLSHEPAEKLKHTCLAGPTVTNPFPDAGGTSPMLLKLHHLPCCCFVEYFDYLKNCLESFSRYNSEDSVAKTLLTMAERTEPGSEFNVQRFSYIQSMWEHLESNKHRFPPEGFSFVHRMYVPLKKDET